MTVPAGLVIMVKGRAFMAVRDFLDETGNPLAEGQGIELGENRFGKGDTFNRWISAVEAEFTNSIGEGLTLQTIDRSYILTGGEVTRLDAPIQPAVTAFRIEGSDQFYLARWMILCGLLEPKEEQTTAWVVPDGHPLLAKHKTILACYRELLKYDDIQLSAYQNAQVEWINAMMTREDFQDDGLTKVHSSVTLSRSAEENLGLVHSDSGGDAFQ